MYMQVNKARHNKAPLRIHDAIDAGFNSLRDLHHLPALHQNIRNRVKSGRWINHPPISDQYGHTAPLFLLFSTYFFVRPGQETDGIICIHCSTNGPGGQPADSRITAGFSHCSCNSFSGENSLKKSPQYTDIRFKGRPCMDAGYQYQIYHFPKEWRNESWQSVQ